MAGYSIYSMTDEDQIKLANIVKDAVFIAMEKEGLLKGTSEDLSPQYAVIIHKPNWFGRIYQRVTEKLHGKPEKGTSSVTVTKIIC